jgi:acetylornithine deacetylase/succinyl-diaminopimelate desuccinylase-like protein
MEEAGLAVERDAWGNLLGRLPGSDPAAAELWTGSHLDTVPAGGRFDGALGVVAGLEAVRSLHTPASTVAVVAFRDEEGSAYAPGCLGSRARCGLVGRDGLEALGLPSPAAGGSLPAVFMEAHIEQGPNLERAGVPLGIVTSIAGQARGEVEFTGASRHAGTTPMDAREDALCAAAEFVLHARDAAAGIEGAVATVGQLLVEPGAVNVVPGRVTLTVDARAPDQTRLDTLLAAIGAEVEVTPPVAMDAAVTRVLGEEIGRLGLPVLELASGAGHDAGILAASGVQAGMLFVRSVGGISHTPEEHTSPEDIALCVDALAATLGRLAG